MAAPKQNNATLQKHSKGTNELLAIALLDEQASAMMSASAALLDLAIDAKRSTERLIDLENKATIDVTKCSNYLEHLETARKLIREREEFFNEYEEEENYNSI